MNWLLACSLFVAAASANTEKATFRAPPAITLPDARPGLQDLYLITLSPSAPSLRLSLATAFPTETLPYGLEYWYLLRNLTESQRYELRVCWPAIQPTAFQVALFNVTNVFDTPDLISSLAAYSESLGPKRQTHQFGESQESVLFLRLQVAADFFTTNQTLMLAPPPVSLDITLDPYLANIFPASLVPTAIYLVIASTCGYLASSYAWNVIISTVRKVHDD